MIDDLPICKCCSHCLMLIKSGINKYDIECTHNENLGAVGARYAKCPGFEQN